MVGGLTWKKETLKFFWYFPDTKFGQMKASYLLKQLVAVEPKFKDQALDFEIFIHFGVSTSSS